MDFDFEGKLKKAKARFTQTPGGDSASPLDFHSRLRGHNKLLNRAMPTVLQAELEADREGIDYQTYELEKALFDNISVLKMNATLFDVLSLSITKKDKETSRAILLWLTRGWEIENEGRHWDIPTAEGQTKNGVAFQRLMWRDQVETYEAGEDDEETLQSRTESHRRRKHPFYWTQPSPYGCFWLGEEQSDDGADVFFYEYSLGYTEAVTSYKRKREDDSWEYPNPTKRGEEPFWLDAPADLQNSNPDLDKCRVVVVDYRDPERTCPVKGCEHPQRIIKTFVAMEDAEIGEDCCVETVDSPFPFCSFFVVGGFMQLAETDPNLRYRPVLGPMYGEAQMVNYTDTLLLTMIRKDYGLNRMYLDVSAVQNPSLLPNEDAGQNTIDLPVPEENKIHFFPGELKRYPSQISPHLIELNKNHRQLMQEYKPNRFSVGTAYDETKSATSTAYTAAQQQARLPFSTLLAESDRTIHRSRKAIVHAVRFWAIADPEGIETRYYYVTSGQDNIVRLNGPAPNSGTVGYVTASMLNSFDWDILIHTKSETQQEAGAAWLTSKDKFVSGAIDVDSLIRNAGADDVEGMKELLELDNNRQLVKPVVEEMKKQLLVRAVFALTGHDPGMAQQQVAGQQGGQPQRPQAPSPGLQGSSQLNAGSAIPPNSIMNRTIPPPVIPSPSGGSSPLRQ